ncbi:MAG TPA: LuxR C-terminal-related transcriptional regulator [Acidimicrobiales bacterium]|nr:LuxR C-terminal-related transcriptional regulator [Acidimicrobiales bacterium]
MGRGDEVALAQESLRRNSCVVLAGASGVGKTRLAREVLAATATRGATPQWVAATRSAGTVALGAFAHLVPGESLAIGEGQDRRAVIFDAIVRAIEHQSAQGRPVVGVDDAHLLDDASATLVHLLVTAGAARVVVTVRSGEPTPDPVVALWKDEQALRIEVQPLSRLEVSELLVATLRGTVDGATARRLFDVTRGNALFLRELVEEGIASGGLSEEAGVWRWDGPLSAGVRLRDLIAERLGGLDEPERDALELVALGEPLADPVVGRLVPDEVLRRLERRRVVDVGVVEGRIELRLAHPLFGDVLLHDASPRRVDDCRRQLADAWGDETTLAPDEVLRVATWRAAVGDQSNPGVLYAGAHRASVLGDDVTSEWLARIVHAAAPTAATGMLLGEALSALGRHDEALDVWQAALDLPGSKAEQAQVAAAIAGVVAWRLDRPDEARRVLRETAGQLSDPVALDLLTSYEALLASLGAPTSTAAIAIAEAELARADLSVSSRLRAQLSAAAGWVDAGKIDRAIEATQEAMRVAMHEQLSGLALYHAMSLAQALVLAGRVSEADALVELGHEASLTSHAEVARGAWCFLRGVLAVFRGRPHVAVATLRESDLLLGRFDYGLRRGILIWHGMAEALRGDAAAAERALDDAQKTNRSRARLYDADWARARAWSLVAAGQLSDAERACIEATDVAVRGDRWTYEVLALHDRARFQGLGGGRTRASASASADVVRRLEELADRVDGRLAPACAEHARALAAGDGPALDAVAVTFGDLGFELFAAEAQAAAAEAHTAAGQKAHAYASAERARRLAAACVGATTPLLRRLSTPGQPGDLTKRERETAELAARGHTDREIADMLYLSVRTVHAHLRSAYSKLGVSGRGGLAAALGIPPDRRRE